jgi:hypothetical protein
MATWKPLEHFCPTNKLWAVTDHLRCPHTPWGRLDVDVDSRPLRVECAKCLKNWNLTETEVHCRCGMIHKMQYINSVITLQAGDIVIRQQGNVVYVQRRSGTVVIGHTTPTLRPKP